MSWPKVKLGDICRIEIGKTPPRAKSDYWGIGYPFLSIKDMNQGKFIIETKEEITDAALQKSNYRLVPKGTLLMSFKLSIGKLGITEVDMYTNEAIAALYVDESRVSKEYLYHALQSIDLLATTDRAVMGATLNKRKLALIPVPLPPLEEQKRIAAILDKADKIQVYSEHVNSARTRFHSATFLDLFGDSTIEERYSRTTIDENSITVSKGTTPMTHGMDFVNQGIPFLRVQDLVKNPVDPFFSTKAIDQATHDFLSRSQLKPNDILISIAGTIGRVSIVSKGSPEMNCNQAVAFVRLAETSVLRHKYLVHWLNSRDATLQMAGSSVTATISNLSLGKIKELKVPVPPLDLQIQFENICERFEMGSTHSVRINNMVDSIKQEILT